MVHEPRILVVLGWSSKWGYDFLGIAGARSREPHGVLTSREPRSYPPPLVSDPSTWCCVWIGFQTPWVWRYFCWPTKHTELPSKHTKPQEVFGRLEGGCFKAHPCTCLDIDPLYNAIEYVLHWTWMVGRLLSFWNGPLGGVFFQVCEGCRSTCS